jgi:PKD repeat protein
MTLANSVTKKELTEATTHFGGGVGVVNIATAANAPVSVFGFAEFDIPKSQRLYIAYKETAHGTDQAFAFGDAIPTLGAEVFSSLGSTIAISPTARTIAFSGTYIANPGDSGFLHIFRRAEEYPTNGNFSSYLPFSSETAPSRTGCAYTYLRLQIDIPNAFGRELTPLSISISQVSPHDTIVLGFTNYTSKVNVVKISGEVVGSSAVTGTNFQQGNIIEDTNEAFGEVVCAATSDYAFIGAPGIKGGVTGHVNYPANYDFDNINSNGGEVVVIRNKGTTPWEKTVRFAPTAATCFDPLNAFKNARVGSCIVTNKDGTRLVIGYKGAGFNGSVHNYCEGVLFAKYENGGATGADHIYIVAWWNAFEIIGSSIGFTNLNAIFPGIPFVACDEDFTRVFLGQTAIWTGFTDHGAVYALTTTDSSDINWDVQEKNDYRFRAFDNASATQISPNTIDSSDVITNYVNYGMCVSCKLTHPSTNFCIATRNDAGELKAFSYHINLNPNPQSLIKAPGGTLLDTHLSGHKVGTIANVYSTVSVASSPSTGIRDPVLRRAITTAKWLSGSPSEVTVTTYQNGTLPVGETVFAAAQTSNVAVKIDRNFKQFYLNVKIQQSSSAYGSIVIPFTVNNSGANFTSGGYPVFTFLPTVTNPAKPLNFFGVERPFHLGVETTDGDYIVPANFGRCQVSVSQNTGANANNILVSGSDIAYDTNATTETTVVIKPVRPDEGDSYVQTYSNVDALKFFITVFFYPFGGTTQVLISLNTDWGGFSSSELRAVMPTFVGELLVNNVSRGTYTTPAPSDASTVQEHKEVKWLVKNTQENNQFGAANTIFPTPTDVNFSKSTQTNSVTVSYFSNKDADVNYDFLRARLDSLGTIPEVAFRWGGYQYRAPLNYIQFTQFELKGNSGSIYTNAEGEITPEVDGYFGAGLIPYSNRCILYSGQILHLSLADLIADVAADGIYTIGDVTWKVQKTLAFKSLSVSDGGAFSPVASGETSVVGEDFYVKAIVNRVLIADTVTPLLRVTGTVEIVPVAYPSQTFTRDLVAVDIYYKEPFHMTITPALASSQYMIADVAYTITDTNAISSTYTWTIDGALDAETSASLTHTPVIADDRKQRVFIIKADDKLDYPGDPENSVAPASQPVAAIFDDSLCEYELDCSIRKAFAVFEIVSAGGYAIPGVQETINISVYPETGAPLAPTGTFTIQWGDGTEDTVTTSQIVTHVFPTSLDTETVRVTLTTKFLLHDDIFSRTVPVTFGPDFTIRVPNNSWTGYTFVERHNANINPKEIAWNFGDGTTLPSNSRNKVAIHKYSAPGEYTVTMTSTLTDIHNPTPIVLISTKMLKVPSELYISITDIEQLPNSAYNQWSVVKFVALTRVQPTKLSWNFGDHASSDNTATDNMTVKHRYESTGIFKVVCNAEYHTEDGHIYSETANTTITIAPRAPPQDVKPFITASAATSRNGAQSVLEQVSKTGTTIMIAIMLVIAAGVLFIIFA